MYPVSQAYLDLVQRDDRTFYARAFIQPVNGDAFWVYGDDMLENSMSLSEQVVPGDAIALGGTVAASLSLTILNPDGLYEGVQFNGAQINPSVGLELDDGSVEWVPLGVFLVDSVAHAVPYQRVKVNTIALQAMDRLIMLEQSFADVNVSFPITAGALLTAVCAFCGLSRAASAMDFLNDDFSITNAPDGDMSCRDIVGYIAELAGCFARSDRTGNLEFVWFKNPATDTPDVTLQPLGRINFSIEDTPITVTGVSYEAPDGVIRVGEPDGNHDIALSDNPLIAANPEPILQSVYDAVEGFSYLPCTTTRHDDPALQAGDMALHPDVNGVDYKSIVTSHEYKFRGRCELKASGLPPLTAGWRSKFQKRVSTLQRQINNLEGPQLDAFADAVGLAFGMLAGVTGGHFIQGNDLGDPQHAGKSYLADNEDITQAMDVWQFSLAGIAHYTQGLNSPPQSAWLGNGRLVIPILNATQMTTGTLSSNNGISWIDLDSGSYSFAGGLLSYDSATGIMNIQNPFNEYIRFSGSTIELGRADSDTIVSITNNGFYINQRGIDQLYLRDGRAHVQELQVENYVYFQNWAQFPMQNGNLAIAWIGG